MRLISNEDGLTLTEYGLVAAMISIAIFSIMSMAGHF